MRYAIKNEIDGLVKNGQWEDAVERLAAFSDETRDPMAMTRLRDLRMQAFNRVHRNKNKDFEKATLRQHADLFPDVTNAIPEVHFDELTVENFTSALNHHGSLIVRNLLTNQIVEELKEGIEKTLAAFDRTQGEDLGDIKSDPWFAVPRVGHDGYDKHGVHMMRQTGSFWTMFSPAMTQTLVSLFSDLHFKPLLRDYFGSEPCLSFNKWVLRKVKPLESPADWHQDGAFMGKGIKSVNLWMALTECGEGTKSPGMDLVPKRLNKVLEAGTNGAFFDWSVSEKSVMEWFKDSPPVRPHFNPGDAIFFDHFNMHATSYSKDFTDVRYAIETWFFALDSYAVNQSPVIW